jgi:hypothetical protein
MTSPGFSSGSVAGPARRLLKVLLNWDDEGV